MALFSLLFSFLIIYENLHDLLNYGAICGMLFFLGSGGICIRGRLSYEEGRCRIKQFLFSVVGFAL